MRIRPLAAEDQPFLWEMLYQALYVPPGELPFPREIVHDPAISRYAEGWGRSGDAGFAALDGERLIGAIWLRLLQGDNGGFGYVDDRTPELSIALLPEYRGQGIGSRLLARLIESARGRCGALSLSVSPDNPARRLYERFGFEVANSGGASLTMVKRLGNE